MAESIKTAGDLIRVYHAKDIPVYMSGPPGLGKSSLYKQLAKELKIGFIDLRLGMMDPVDLLGLPTVDKNGQTNWAKPAFWPDAKRDGEKGIILFDELTDTTRSMQSATYQIILDRKIGPHVLLPGWYPAAAGNRREDKAAANVLSSALANRFAHIDVVQDVDAFIEWGDRNNISPYIIGFIRFRPQLLLSMEGADLRAYPTPRSWERASAVADADKSMRLRLMQGLVGAGAAAEFEGYMKTMDLPDLDKIVENPKKTRIPSEPSSKYALASMLARYADRSNFGAIYEYVKRPEFGRDFCICTVIDATKRDSGLTETKTFIQFANDNSDLHL